MEKHSCRRITAAVFPNTTLQQLQYTQPITITSKISTATITTGIFLETS